jgi:hypothetical protein
VSNNHSHEALGAGGQLGLWLAAKGRKDQFWEGNRGQPGSTVGAMWDSGVQLSAAEGNFRQVIMTSSMSHNCSTISSPYDSGC